MTVRATPIPMATGARSPVWPLPDVVRKRWTFGTSRAKGERRHAGVDLYAPRGSMVLSPESGMVVAAQRFNGPHAYALLIALDSGPVVLLGEVEPHSWNEFESGPGARVEAGQPVARVGINPGDDQMLHFEMYRTGTIRNHRWYTSSLPPVALLDPTQYLKSASALDADQMDDPGDDSDDAGEVDDDDTADDQGDDDVGPDIMPHDPGDPPASRAGGAFLGLGLVFLLARALGDR